MASAVRTLLKKKKLTGEELGKILLIDLVDALTGKPNLNKEEIETIRNGIDNAYDSKIYNDYVSIHRYLLAMASDYDTEEKRLTIYYMNLMLRSQLTISAEQTYITLTRQPLIMTKEDYSRQIEEERAVIKTYTYSLYHLFSYELDQYLKPYEAGEATPYNAIFDSLRLDPISDDMQKLIKIVYEEEVAKISRYDALKDYLSIYYKDEAEDELASLNIKRDYPKLLKAILDKYSKIKELNYLGKIKKLDYTKDDLISFDTAYKLGILYAKESYEKVNLAFGRPITGIAVIEDLRNDLKQEELIKNNRFYYSIPPAVTYSLSENLLANEEAISQIIDNKKTIKDSLKRLNAFRYAIEKIIEITGVKELVAFINDSRNDLIKEINKHAEEFKFTIWRYGLIENERPQKELREEIFNLFSVDFTEEDIAIQTEEKAKVEEIIASSSKKSEAITQLTNYLTRLKA